MPLSELRPEEEEEEEAEEEERRRQTKSRSKVSEGLSLLVTGGVLKTLSTCCLLVGRQHHHNPVLNPRKDLCRDSKLLGQPQDDDQDAIY